MFCQPGIDPTWRKKQLNNSSTLVLVANQYLCFPTCYHKFRKQFHNCFHSQFDYHFFHSSNTTNTLNDSLHQPIILIHLEEYTPFVKVIVLIVKDSKKIILGLNMIGIV